MKINKNILAKLALIVATLIWASSFVITKTSLDAVPCAYILAVRYSIGALALVIVFFKKLKNITKEYLWQGLIIGSLLFLATYMQFLGLKFTTPGKTAFLTAGQCIIIPFFLWIIDKKRPDIYNFISSAICVAGIGLISLTADLTLQKGDVISLIGAACFAAHVISISKFTTDKDPVIIAILQFAFCAVISIIASLFETPVVIPVTADVVWSFLYLAIVATSFALLLQTISQKFMSPVEAAIILSLEAVFGVVISVLMGTDSVTLRMGAGFALIFIAVIVSETKLSFLKKKGGNSIETK